MRMNSNLVKSTKEENYCIIMLISDGFSSAKYLPIMHESLDLIPITNNNNNKICKGKGKE
jgi:hypothetical protein